MGATEKVARVLEAESLGASKCALRACRGALLGGCFFDAAMGCLEFWTRFNSRQWMLRWGMVCLARCHEASPAAVLWEGCLLRFAFSHLSWKQRGVLPEVPRLLPKRSLERS